MLAGLARRQEAALRGSHDRLRVHIAESHHRWGQLGMAGEAADALRESLRQATEALHTPAEQMRRAADILSHYAPLFERLGHLLSARRFYGDSLAELDALADALDWACARQLDALCTPEMAPPPRRLEDFTGLDLAQIHQIQLSTADPRVVELARRNPDVTVLEASPGRLVALVDPQRLGTAAAQVTTYVGGVGSADPEGWEASIARARALAQATSGPAVAWMGYSAPPDLARAAHERPAEAGAEELVRFQRELGARFPGAQRILVGYSYGSVTVGKAAQRALIAEDVVLVGSPGASASSAAQLHGRVWAATNAGDPIAAAATGYGGIHGPQPAHPSFGARPVPGANGRPGDHSSYWQDPALMAGLGAIAAAR